MIIKVSIIAAAHEQEGDAPTGHIDGTRTPQAGCMFLDGATACFNSPRPTLSSMNEKNTSYEPHSTPLICFPAHLRCHRARQLSGHTRTYDSPHIPHIHFLSFHLSMHVPRFAISFRALRFFRPPTLTCVRTCLSRCSSLPTASCGDLLPPVLRN